MGFVAYCLVAATTTWCPLIPTRAPSFTTALTAHTNDPRNYPSTAGIALSISRIRQNPHPNIPSIRRGYQSQIRP
ncbi:hypothetical protein B9Z19DRAFT_1088114 [Tuber borchii]|uniref:Uncharacterized protein n=1 Tax=Tuber borchii TaxID=42251 RepID=A0A2T6ZM88_TUBBO|nr:hypothetical protein B9Z19DRAFT_1088114 [Tuber borchii]